MDAPQIIEFDRIGRSSIGYISVAESNHSLPFELKRVFWTYFTPESIIRGRHAHHKTEMILIAVSGRIIVNTEMSPGEIVTFDLDSPARGLYIPPMCWHTMQYSHTAVQLVLASSHFDPDDYIRDYKEFCRIVQDINP